jgi:hypothetical protein
MKMILNFHNHGCVEPARARTHVNPVAAEPGSVKFAWCGQPITASLHAVSLAGAAAANQTRAKLWIPHSGIGCDLLNFSIIILLDQNLAKLTPQLKSL